MATDVKLVKAVLSGERQQFALLVERYQRDIYNLAYRSTNNRQDAEDVTQESFLRAFRGLAKYDTNRSFRTWLYAIALNICRDWVRAKDRRPQAVPWLESDGAGHGTGAMARAVGAAGWQAPGPFGPDRLEQPHDVVIAREVRGAVQEAIMALESDYRLLVILFYMRDLPQSEIAEIMGLPLSVVKNRLYRARRRLRQTLGPVLGEVK